jgi:DNA-binding response OmpR family regulator
VELPGAAREESREDRGHASDEGTGYAHLLPLLRRPYPAKPTSAPMKPPTKKLVLVVDDDASIRTLVTTTLIAKGYETVQAADGMAASAMLARMTRPPDLIICDVMMPNIDGFSLIRGIKKTEVLRTVPIIFLTAKTDALDVIRGINLGARHYVPKPFGIKELLSKVEKAIG